MRSPDELIPLVKSEITAIAQSDNKAIVAQPQPVPSDTGTPWVVGGSFMIGGAALWAAIAKLLEKYGNNTLDIRQQKITQELEQSKEISQFYLSEANRDSETINKTLNLFVAKHLDTTKQMFDMYYDLLEKFKKLQEESERKDERLANIETVMKDILAVMRMHDRQNKA